MLARVRGKGQYAEYDPNKQYPDPRTGYDPRANGRNPNGRTASMGPGRPGTEPPPPRGVVPTGGGREIRPLGTTPPLGEPQAPQPKVGYTKNAPFRGMIPVSAAQAQREDDRRSADWRRGTEIHPSGYDRGGGPAYSSRRVPGYGPMFTEQMGHPAFMDPNYRYPGDRTPIYPTNVGGRTIPAEYAAAARRAVPDVPAGYPAGLPMDMTQADTWAYPAKGAGGRTTPVAGDARSQPGVIPTGGVSESDADRIEREAFNRFPAASQGPQRADYMDKRQKEIEDRRTKFGVETIRGEKAKQGVIGAAERAAAGTASRERIAEENNTAREKRQQTDLAHRERENEKKRNAEAERLVFNARTKQILQGTSETGRTLREFAKTQPNLIGNPFEMQRLLGPQLRSLGVDPRNTQQMNDLSQHLLGVDPTAGPRGAVGGGGAPVNGAIDQAAARNLQPGATVSRMGDDGYVYDWVVTNRGTLLRDDNSRRKP